MLRDALHSVFLYHAIPKGLNLAICWPGALPLYAELDTETRTLCEEVVLNASADAKHLERFIAFVTFRANSVACLPVLSPGLVRRPEDEEGSWRRAAAVQKEAKETQKALAVQRKPSSPAEQKRFLRSLRCGTVCSAEPLQPERGAGRPDPCRAEGPGDKERLAATLSSKGTARPDELARYFNAELRRRVCVLATPGKGSLSEVEYREYFSAGCDVCGTSTLVGGDYEECRAAAQLAKSAASEVTRAEPARPRFVAGVLGPTQHSLSSPSPGGEDPSLRSASWEVLVAAYTEQVRGLMDGGADMLALEAVSDTLNAKAAIFAIDEYFEQSKKEKPPLIITAVIADSGRLPCGQSVEAFLVSVRHANPMSVGISGSLGAGPTHRAAKVVADMGLSWCHATGTGGSAEELGTSLAEYASDRLINFAGAAWVSASHVASAASRVKAASPRPLPALPKEPSMQLAGLDAYTIKPDDGCQIVGQRCNMGGSAKFKSLIDAYKYNRQGGRWEAALEVCAEQCDLGADLLDLNFDSPLIDAKWAMGKFVRLCAADPRAGKAPLVLSSAEWPVIEEGLRNAPGKSIANAISLAQGEEELLRLARGCLRYGAAVVVVPIDSLEEFPAAQERALIGQRAYELLRRKLDFPAEDIIFDCGVLPLNSERPGAARDFLDALAQLKLTCPRASFLGGVGGLSLPHRGVPVLREALHSVLLYHAIPVGLNMAIVDPGVLPRYGDIEAQTKKVCEEAILSQSDDDNHLERLDMYGAYLAGGAVTDVPAALVPQYDFPGAIPKRPSPGITQPIGTLVQATGTITSSIFQNFASKAHAALTFHRNNAGFGLKREVWYSSISAWMGQGGTGPIAAASLVMDNLALRERHMSLQTMCTAVEWGAVGDIGLRRTLYGSRDVFAQFDLGQKLLAPENAQFLMRAVCCAPADPGEVLGMAYLDQTWQMTLAGVVGGGGLDRKTFADV